MTLYDVIRQLMSGFDLNVVTASAFHPLYSMYECCMAMHALSPPSVCQYTLCNDYFVTVVKPWFLYWIIT